jgi:CheY-like chemotaxis protein
MYGNLTVCLEHTSPIAIFYNTIDCKHSLQLKMQYLTVYDSINLFKLPMEKHILLIDDDPDELDIFMSALRDGGLDFKYNAVTNAGEAIRFLQRFVPDYIVLDYKMPKINGLECLVEIKNMQHISHIPVIMYSSLLDESIIETAMIIGAAGCIKKPFDMRALPSLLKPFL